MKQPNLTLSFLAEPTDVNFGGKVHGGIVMKWIDQAAYACASGWSGKYCVTAYVGGIRFFNPIMIGHLIRVEAKVIYTGRTSMHISVNVLSSPPTESKYTQATHCIIIMVAVDENSKPTPVPKWVPVSEIEKQLEDYAKLLMERRKSVEEVMLPYMCPSPNGDC